MPLRHALFTLAAAVLVIPLARKGIESARSGTRSIAQQQKGSSSAGVVQLRNTSLQPARVEIGVAHGGDCAGKTQVVRSMTVAAGRMWVVRSSQPICDRREKLGVDGQRRLLDWEQKKPAAGQVEEVIL